MDSLTIEVREETTKKIKDARTKFVDLIIESAYKYLESINNVNSVVYQKHFDEILQKISKKEIPQDMRNLILAQAIGCGYSCILCGKPCDFDHSSVENIGIGEPGNLHRFTQHQPLGNKYHKYLYGGGYVEETCEILVSFAKIRLPFEISITKFEKIKIHKVGAVQDWNFKKDGYKIPEKYRLKDSSISLRREFIFVSETLENLFISDYYLNIIKELEGTALKLGYTNQVNPLSKTKIAGIFGVEENCLLELESSTMIESLGKKIEAMENYNQKVILFEISTEDFFKNSSQIIELSKRLKKPIQSLFVFTQNELLYKQTHEFRKKLEINSSSELISELIEPIPWELLKEQEELAFIACTNQLAEDKKSYIVDLTTNYKHTY